MVTPDELAEHLSAALDTAYAEMAGQLGMFGGSTDMKRLLIVAMLALAACSPSLPRCEEDQYIVGYGEFEDGTWASYGCGPAVDDAP